MAEPELFVGWAGPSRSALPFLAAVTIGLLALFAGTAAAITQLQTSPGASVREQTEHVGVYHRAPYGHLVVPTDDGPVTVLLSLGGKNGLQRSFLDKEGAVVRAKGLGLSRDDRRFLEVWSLDDATLPDPALQTVRDAEWEDLGPVTLTGEIVDSKCYYGRMRPGSGKGHRACAQLCVRGGIPPVLVTEAPDGRREHFVVTGPGRSDVHEAILPFVAEPIDVRGTLWRRGDLLAVETDLATGITRRWPSLR